ncbi:hypothetical protein [Pontibacter ruber]|uniref:Tetratricopeptide repeat protein n=1 Tax=Pontibacter ruber TaxID=1343895 RepID=A0ABW5D2S4_9BACT|nr:hypothetical protein [Pontibacter ruber]
MFRFLRPAAPRYCALLFLLFLWCCSLPSYAAADKADYVKVYYPTINQAELSILAKDYAAASELYKQAFAAVPEPFAKDYYNAAVCAMLLQDEKQTYAYLDRLVLKGVTLPYLAKQEVFKPLQGTKSWSKFEKSYPKKRKKFERSAELDLRADLDELYAQDKYFRQAKGGLRVYGDTLRKIEANNVEKLLKVIKKHGYPGERMVGVGDTLEYLPRFAIVIQRQTKAKNGYDFTGILTEAVQQGRLAPHAAAYLMEQQQGKSLYKTKALVRVNCASDDCDKGKKLKNINKYLTESISEKEQEKVDKARAELGLESLSDYKKKVLYGLEDTRFKFNFVGAVANYYVPSKEAARVLLDGLVVAE